jgi:chromosome segregation ATPase
MLIFTLPSALLEITIFGFAVVAFFMAVRFFMASRKRLEELFPGTVTTRKLLPFGFDRSGFLIPKTPMAPPVNPPAKVFFKTSGSASTTPDHTRDEIRELRQQVKLQQAELERALQKMAHIGQHTTAAAEEKSAIVLAERQRMEQLRLQLEQKDAEIQRLKQQETYAQKMQDRFEEVQSEFEKLQEKMQQMEQQAWQNAELTIQLEHAEQATLQLEQTVIKKEEKLRELSLENQRLHDSFSDLEDKLSEANLQRQQLMKKVQLLESLNADMLQMAESNRKLKTEIARVAELESMLQMISEERYSMRR